MNRDAESVVLRLTKTQSEHRIEKIQEWLPEALEKQRESDCKGTSALADRFRVAMAKNRPQMVSIAQV